MLEEAGGREADLPEGGLLPDEVGPGRVDERGADGRGQVGDEVGFDGRLGFAEALRDDELVGSDAVLGSADHGGGDVGMLGLVEVGRDEACGERQRVTEQDSEKVAFRVEGGGERHREGG